MIDPKLFTVERILDTMLDDRHGNVNAWRKHATIIPAYRAPFAGHEDAPKCVVKFGESSFLRYSRGPAQGYFWDLYGEDMATPELALMALLQAPVPPQIVRPLVEAARERDELRARLTKLESGLSSALDGWAYASQYKGEFLADKHGDAEDIAELRALLGNAESDGTP